MLKRMGKHLTYLCPLARFLRTSIREYIYRRDID